MTRRRLISISLAVVILICAGVMLYSPIRLRLVVGAWLGEGMHPSNAPCRRPQIPSEFEG